MSKTANIAIIGGSKEAIDLARGFERSGIRYCLFETPYYPSPHGLVTRRYGADSDWHRMLDGFDALVFAPHPFAFSLFGLVENLSLLVLALLRAPWTPEPADNWLMVADAPAAARALLQSGAQAPLLALGRERLQPFIDLAGPPLLVRCRTLPKPALQGRGRVEYMTGPFTAAEEITYLQAHGTDCIVVHNAGGQGGWPKLAAARELSIPVIMIERPHIALPERAETPQQARAWLRQRVGLDL